MQYAMFHRTDPDMALQWNDDVAAELFSWINELFASGGALPHGSRLRPAQDATTIKIRTGQLIITDGPYAETKELMGGYGVVACDSLDEAVRWASKHIDARTGSIEVRGLPDSPARGPLPAPSAGKTRYMMLVCTDPSVDPGLFDDSEPVDSWVADTVGRGIRVFGSELESAESTRSVRVRDKRTLVIDGPFAETKEQIAGFDLLDCADLDEAIEVARRHPMARGGILQVNALWPFEES
jgi:hypothetical protein